MSITERVHQFGPAGSLVGIVSLPPGDEGKADGSAAGPFVLLLNSGLVHRVGPFGMGVQLARRLAGRGFRVLRFDQAGLGDSAARAAGSTADDPAVIDARDAMDFLRTRYGAERFVVGGLCSGAMNAHRICLADARVVGMWLLDGYAYPTRAYYREVVKRKLQRPETWGPSARRVLERAAQNVMQWRARSSPATHEAAPDASATAAREALFFQDWPNRADARTELETMLARGASALYVYTGGWSSFVAEEQFDEMFPRLERRRQITVRYQRRADHTYVALDDREAMFQHVERFLRAMPAGDERSRA